MQNYGFLIICLCFALLGNAQIKTSENTKLSEIVLSISKWKQEQQHIPQKIVQLNAEEIENSASQTTADVLQRSGSVFIQKSQLGGGSPIIRGFSTNRLLLTVDGVRMNTAIFRSGNVQNVIAIDPFSLDRTEVIFGPGSVAYGSDAIGGVLNFYTKNPLTEATKNTRYSGNLTTRYTTANQEKTVHGDIAIGLRRIGLLTSFTLTDFDDQLMGSYGPREFLRKEYVVNQNKNDKIIQNSNDKKQRFTGYRQYNFMQKIVFKLNKSWLFTAGFLYSKTSDVPRYDRLIESKNEQPRFAEWNYGPQKWNMMYIKSAHTAKKGLYDSMKLTTAYQFFEESRISRRFEDTIENRTKEQLNAYSINVDFKKEFQSTGTSLFYGLEYVHNKVASTGTTFNTLLASVQAAPARYPDGSIWQSTAAYINYTQELSNTLSTQIGGRYNYTGLEADFISDFYAFPFDKTTITKDAFTYNLGLNWIPASALEWRLNYATAFRSPNIDDIGKIFDPEPDTVIVPNPSLKPEYATNYELGVVLKPLRGSRLNLTVYYTQLKNALVRQDFALNGAEIIQFNGERSRVQALQNASRSQVYGFEAGATVYFSKALSANARYTITKGEDELRDGTKEPSRHVVPQFGNLHVVYKVKKLMLDVFGEYSGSLSYNQLAPSEQNKPHLYALDRSNNPYSPSWYTLNLRSAYRLTKHIQTIGVFENISDQRYRTYSSGVAAAGRSFSLTLKYTF